MEITGFICALLVGISLGLLGSGGSILTVPIMVYMLHVKASDAVIYSLFVVGVTSMTGGITYIQKKLVSWAALILFAIPSITGVFVTRKYLLPLIPDPITLFHYTFSKDDFTLVIFGCLMIIASVKMIRSSNSVESERLNHVNYLLLIFIGIVCGILTGFLGVGGGFIIIPALVLFADIPIRMSVGTSLVIIAVNSFTGFFEELVIRQAPFNYFLVLSFSLFSVAGIFTGYRLSLFLKPGQLKKIFGWFILFTGFCTLVYQLRIIFG